MLVRICIKWAIRICHHWSWFSKLSAVFLAAQVSEIDKHGQKVPAGRSNSACRLNCLAVHSDLFRGDLEALVVTEQVRIFIVPTGLQQLVHQAFHPDGVNIVDYYHADVSSKIHCQREQLISFLLPFFCKLKTRFNLNVVVAPNFRHIPDLEWGATGQAAGMLSVVLFREGLVNFHRGFEGTLRRQNRFGRLRADSIFVVNHHIERIMVESGFADKNQTKVVGTPRMDCLVRRAYKVRKQPKETRTGDKEKLKILVLYFFPGKYQKGFFDDDGLWRPPGVPHALFFQVFETIFELGHNRSDVEILIKVKKDQHSIHYLTEAFPDIGQTLKKRKNIRIKDDVDLHKEMETACGVVGLNSTAVLESGLFGRRVILPYFCEFRDSEWSERFGLKEDLSAFDVAEDQSDFKKMLERCLVDPVAPARQITKRLDLFNEWVSSIDGLATERCISELDRLINRQTEKQSN